MHLLHVLDDLRERLSFFFLAAVDGYMDGQTESGKGGRSTLYQKAKPATEPSFLRSEGSSCFISYIKSREESDEPTIDQLHLRVTSFLFFFCSEFN